MDRRPESFVEVLRATADWMDTADKAIDAICRLRGVDNPSNGDEVQRDLRALADRLEARPWLLEDLDAEWKAIG